MADVMLDTPEKIANYRAVMLLSGLKSEMRGLRLTNKARTCYSIIKSERGFKGSRIKVYAQYGLWLHEQGIILLSDEDKNWANQILNP